MVKSAAQNSMLQKVTHAGTIIYIEKANILRQKETHTAKVSQFSALLHCRIAPKPIPIAHR
jgi:hypothetical protein